MAEETGEGNRKIQKGYFIEIDYIGRIKQSDKIFDLTDEKAAKENNIYNEKAKYGPVIICVGNNDIVKGLDNFLVGKEIGKYKIELEPEDAFGKKETGRMKIFSINHFWQQKINPMPGLQLNFDGIIGTVKSVTGGRVAVDFNHPLAGKQIVYEIDIKRIIEDNSEKLNWLAKLYLDAEASLEGDIAKISLKSAVPEELKNKIGNKIIELIPWIKKVEFVEATAKE